MGCKQRVPARLYWLDGHVSEMKDFQLKGGIVSIAANDGTPHTFIYSGSDLDGRAKLVEIPAPSQDPREEET